MQLPELLNLADANLAELAREHARWLPPTRIQEHTDLLLTAAGTQAAGPWNAVLALGPLPADPARTLHAASAFFDPLGHSSSIYIRAHLDLELELACRQSGYALGSDSPGMLLRATPAPPPALHRRRHDRALDIQIQRADSDAHASAFVEVAARAYETLQIPAALTRKLLSRPERWRSPHYETFLLWEAGRPAAGAQLLFSHGIAGVYWVATLPEARRRGHGERITRAACQHAFGAGARAVILQASHSGESIYRRIGFEAVTRYRTYRRPVPELGGE